MWDTAFWEPVLRDRPLIGRDYESAIISRAFSGSAIGATATAIANTQALTRRHAVARSGPLAVDPKCVRCAAAFRGGYGRVRDSAA
jgi:Na+/glutamate symporter